MIKWWRNWIDKMTEGEGICLFATKQFFGAFVGFLIATAWGAGEKLYNSLSRAPTCKVKLLRVNSLGIKYHWKITIKNNESGSLMIYPKDDVVIDLSTIKKPGRVIKIIEIDPSNLKKHAKGIALDYLDSEIDKKINIEFETYSPKKLNFPIIGDASCSDLLLDF